MEMARARPWDLNNEEQRREFRKHESGGRKWGWKRINWIHRRKTTLMSQEWLP